MNIPDSTLPALFWLARHNRTERAALEATCIVLGVNPRRTISLARRITASEAMRNAQKIYNYLRA